MTDPGILARAVGRLRRSRSSDPGLAIRRYNDVSERKLIRQLYQLSQEELAAVERYERAHRARPAVLDKLRHVRQGGADAGVVEALRDYERKLRSREPLDRPRAEFEHGGRALNELKLSEPQRAADGADGQLRRAQAAQRQG
jgi:hypothetical protein